MECIQNCPDLGRRARIVGRLAPLLHRRPGTNPGGRQRIVEELQEILGDLYPALVARIADVVPLLPLDVEYEAPVLEPLVASFLSEAQQATFRALEPEHRRRYCHKLLLNNPGLKALYRRKLAERGLAGDSPAAKRRRALAVVCETTAPIPAPEAAAAAAAAAKEEDPEERAPEPKPKREAEPKREIEHHAPECCVCRGGAPSVLLLPCKHLAYCGCCWAEPAQRRRLLGMGCPLCRASIDAFIPGVVLP
eukprot:tig00021569_g22346.t1